MIWIVLTLIVEVHQFLSVHLSSFSGLKLEVIWMVEFQWSIRIDCGCRFHNVQFVRSSLFWKKFFLSVHLSGFSGFDFDAIFIKAKRISWLSRWLLFLFHRCILVYTRIFTNKRNFLLSLTMTHIVLLRSRLMSIRRKMIVGKNWTCKDRDPSVIKLYDR